MITTDHDTPEDWPRGGQALQRILLLAAQQGVQAGFLNQPCQVPPLRLQLGETLVDGGTPQIVARFGAPVSTGKTSARRPITRVLRENGVAE